MTGANSKAFDRIDHNISLNKLLQMGVHPALINWISNFSTDRQQRIRVGPTIPSGNQSALVFRKEKNLTPYFLWSWWTIWEGLATSWRL